MRKRIIFGALTAILTFVTMEAQGQRTGLGGVFGGSGPGGIFLVLNKGVQDELKITDDQNAKLSEKMRSLVAKTQETRDKLNNVPEAERRDKTQQAFKEIDEAAAKDIAAILKPEQVKRLKQIERQQNVGATLLTDDEASKALQISDEQKQKLKAINEETQQQLVQMYQQLKDNPLEIRGKITESRKEANEKVLNALSDEQRKQWKELTGNPFEVKLEGFGTGIFGKKK